MRTIEDTTALVTGATDGLGRGLAEQLAADGATVHLHGRDPGRLATTADEICQRTGNERLVTHLADFASLDEVRALADEVNRSSDQLHVLVSNAGIGSARPDQATRQVSRDGHELRFAVNYLAGFLLTLRVLPLLRGSAPARIVYVASLGQAPLDFDDLMLERSYDGVRAYGQSKLAQISSGFELAERLAEDQITVNSLHPSTFMPTKIVLQNVSHSIDSLEDGIAATYRLAVGPDVEHVSGRFFDRQREARANEQAYDRDARSRVWELSLALSGEASP
jgi:NAD(P)-dependent dehydrogenase (short-subunit alcohol dehydrogenase family)